MQAFYIARLLIAQLIVVADDGCIIVESGVRQPLG